jgi:hypothetical protein
MPMSFYRESLTNIPRPFRRAYIREQLCSCMKLFPRNTIFLNLFEWADTTLRVKDEVHDLLPTVVLTDESDCISSRIFAIRHELQNGNKHSIRAAFERAMKSEKCRSNVNLWIYYIKFCFSTRDFREKATEVFYRAVQHCSWSKELILEAFTTLIDNMRGSELRAVFSTIVSKELRVHLDLEEFLEQRQTTQ